MQKAKASRHKRQKEGTLYTGRICVVYVLSTQNIPKHGKNIIKHNKNIAKHSKDIAKPTVKNNLQCLHHYDLVFWH